MSQNKPLVTVVTVTYNAEEFLERTIKSVIKQDYQNIEYIIIDGGSSDGTIDIIKKYEKYISYWVSEKDDGLYHAMNKGTLKATGKWINFMNAGDTFVKKNTISKVSKYFNFEDELICGDILRGKDLNKYYKPKGLGEAYDAVFINHQASFVKTKLMKKFGFAENVKISGDYGFFFRCYIKGKRFKFIDIPISKNLEGGLSQCNNTIAWAEALYLQAKYLKNPLDTFNNKFYQNLINTPDNNKLLVGFLNKLYEELEASLKNKKFILYGFGTVGEIVYNKYKKNILAIVDNNYIKLTKEHNLKVINPKKLKSMEFDYIFISALGNEQNIKSLLIEKYKISRSKIIEIPISRKL